MFKRLLIASTVVLPCLAVTAPAMQADTGIQPVTAVVGAVGGAASSPSAPVQCSFGDGFASIAAMIPDTVGACLTAPTGLGNGDVAQQTTEGQMLWTKADNLPRFVDQAIGKTWVLGPFGLQQRPIGQPFSWEAPTSQVAGVTITSGTNNTNETCVANLIRAAVSETGPAVAVLPYSTCPLS